MNEEKLLLDVSAGKFPGVTTVGNYAVQMIRKIGTKMGTITLVEKKTSCKDVEDNEIIKAANGKFYYCAGDIAVPMQKNGAKFAIQKNSKYVIIEISDNEYFEYGADDADKSDLNNRK